VLSSRLLVEEMQINPGHHKGLQDQMSMLGVFPNVQTD
jgi:hypothetical protein